MLVQPDGKILVCGRFWEDGISYWYGTIMVRYMPDGTLDTSFGTNGKVAVIGSGYPYGNPAVGADMALQPDGKILLIGQYAVAQGVIVQRYSSAGVVDTTFGNNGTAVVRGMAGNSITLQPDGKIVGTGWEYKLGNPYYDAIVVFRLNTDGSLDNSFGSAETGVVMINNGYDGAKVLVEPDGKILIVGMLLNFTDIRPTILLARYNPDGSLDSSFGTGGKVTYRINDQDSSPGGAALQPDGKIVVAGVYSSGSENHTVMLRYNPSGSLDTGFGANGIASIESGLFGANTVLVQTDGKITAISNASDGASGHNGFAVVRLNSNGSLDPSFGAGGVSVFPINAGGTNYAYASHGALQPDGKILVTGYFGNYYTDSHETIALIRVDGGQRSCPNPIDCNEFFVRQHYSDFLNRVPDAGGLSYWTGQLEQCGADAACIHQRRIGVSAAFFVEMEFQDTGYYVDRFYKASFGRQPNYAEFTADRANLIGGPNLEANKQAFADQWVQRAAFLAAYSITMSNTEFVNKLFDTASLTASTYNPQRQQEIDAMNVGRSRALVLRDVIEIPDFKNIPDPNDPRYSQIKQTSQYNPAFVLMQYFGYLHRDLDQSGYDFWLDVVNNREPNNYRAMVCAFITSTEYQLRFGSAVTRSNADCGR
jgi:uncharacterized delta-60 repeat protein